MKNKHYIGCSGFTERSWKVYFYPEELPSKEYLSYYSTKINAVEINSTFYRRPTVKTLEKWYGSTEKDFRFFIKIPKTISHIKKLINTKEDTDAFCEHISSGLKEKLAGFLFQLPPSYHFTDENLEQLIQTVNDNYLNVVEFRHNSWWNDKVLKKLQENKIIFAGVSFPKDISDEVMINNDHFLYYRLHGVPVLFKSEYSEEELQIIAEKIKRFEGTSYMFFNNTWGIAGIKNALELRRILTLQ
ncbi:Uncharacterized conserved protein YecE, DUF72 family [Kaistella jeonii]|uniref:Histidine kinase n=2 Tax=Kaistella jeonii TaxID=266749 RepID=A0A0C1DA25_9FLAO|nr:histidine kinase [Kaistella jeonii]SFB72577.1 Uncharacterized conserved protein YecE, DUF72 family [Kaistella jeonii]VEI94978.1 Protein of uncharacterised function DUF72 [Kaistella jeonii]